MATIRQIAAEGIRQYPTRIIIGELMDQLADEIDNAPYAGHQNLRDLWTEVGDFAVARSEEIGEELEIRTVDEAPYDTKDGCQRMFEDISNGYYYVQTFTNNHPHPFWICPVWKAFRIIHDIDGHVMASADFTVSGEERTFQIHVQSIPEHFYPVIFSETLFQVASTNRNHRFPEFHKALLTLTSHEVIRRLIRPWRTK